jgi:riboflavin kinase/FMN adenylyltransferase
MEVCDGIAHFTPPPTGITLTIGNFDGVHRGHERIIATARAVAVALGTPMVAMTFEPHPLAVIAPERTPARLATAAEKLHLLERCGVGVCIVVRSEPALLSLSAEAFLTQLSEQCRPRVIVEGADFNFGRGRGGSVQTLRAFADRLGFSVHLVETACCTDLPEAPTIRSSAIRAALRDGRVEVARAMLGRPHRIVGTVGGGAGRGASLGFPTANLEGIPHLVPQRAVYAALAQLEDGSRHPAAVNVGLQPTFEQSAPRVEAHLLDFCASLRGRHLGLHFLARLRGQQRFARVDDLLAQIRRDAAATRTYAAAALLREGPRPIPL